MLMHMVFTFWSAAQALLYSHQCVAFSHVNKVESPPMRPKSFVRSVNWRLVKVCCVLEFASIMHTSKSMTAGLSRGRPNRTVKEIVMGP